MCAIKSRKMSLKSQNPFLNGKLSQKEQNEISKYFSMYPQHGGRHTMWPFYGQPENDLHIGKMF